MVASLSFLKSKHTLMDPFFFLTSTMGLVQGVLLLVILPDLRKALMFFSNSAWYFTGTRYGLPFTGTSVLV
uniref:Uncharacterized protein n=1 Tax=Caenorhabditis japonica TaxID=281687 RepID=A0A8R1IMK0_CAEJA